MADIPNRVVSLGLTVLLAAAGVGCGNAPKKKTTTGTGGGSGGGSVSGSGGGGPDDAGAGGAPGENQDAAPIDGDASALCWRALSAQQPFGGCPAMYADDWKTRVCTVAPTVQEQDCGGYQTRTFGWGTHASICYYESANQTLVGAKFIDDVTTFCDGASRTLTAGEIPPMAICSAAVDVQNPCDSVDAGTLEAGSDAQADSGCWRPLDGGYYQPLGGCPATFDGTACRYGFTSVPGMVEEQTCLGYRLRQYAFGTHSYSCYYDPATLVLVAGEFWDDVPLCRPNSNMLTVGDIPPAGTCGDKTKVAMPCAADAGSQ